MDNRWVVPLHCDGRERGGEEEARFPRRPLQTRLVRAEDGELWPLLPPLGIVSTRVTWGKAPPRGKAPPYLTTNLRMPVGPSHD